MAEIRRFWQQELSVVRMAGCEHWGRGLAAHDFRARITILEHMQELLGIASLF
jgi:hypothetical protein